MEHKIVCLLLWQVLVVLQVYIHHDMIARGHKPIYIQWFCIRGFAAIMHGVLYDVTNMVEYLPLLLFQLSTHYVIFNPGLNALRGLSFWYLGADSGWLDSFLIKRPGLHAVVYLMSWFLMTLSVYLLLIRH